MANIYKCKNCGAEMILLKNSVSGICPYCGVPEPL